MQNSDKQILADISDAMQNTDLLAEIQSILDNALMQIENINPNCNACGNCCDFANFGHRLYVSTGELANLISQEPIDAQIPIENLKCPYQKDNLCLARNARPLGCRLFFCDDKVNLQYQQIYEAYYDKIKQVHLKFSTAYNYLELSAGLKIYSSGGNLEK